MTSRRHFDPKAAQRRAEANRRENGLAPRNVIVNAAPGAVFLVNDRAVGFPEERVAGATRTFHDARHAIIVQASGLTLALSPKSVLVVPCSASQTTISPWDFEIPVGEAAFTASGVVAYTTLIQPILKSDLKRFVGELSPETFVKLQHRLARGLGLLAEPSLPLVGRDVVPGQTEAEGSPAQTSEKGRAQ